MLYFDYETLAREAGVPENILHEWREGFRIEYPEDEMMVELRLLRACQAALGGPDELRRVVEVLAEEFGSTISG